MNSEQTQQKEPESSRTFIFQKKQQEENYQKGASVIKFDDDEDNDSDQEENKQDNNIKVFNNNGGEQQQQIQQQQQINNTIQMNQVFELNFSDLQEFVEQPIPQGTLLQCEIQRKSKMFSSYEFRMNKGNNNKQILMSAKKTLVSKNPEYNIMLGFNLKQSSGNSFQGVQVGRLSGNFFGTEYQLYDNGKSPSSLFNVISNSSEQVKLRKNLAGIINKSVDNLRQLEIVLPLGNEKTGEVSVIQPQRKQDQILDKYKSYKKFIKQNKFKINENQTLEYHNLKDYQNQQPIYNPKNNNYEVEFSKRCIQASVKNFMIVDNKENLIKNNNNNKSFSYLQMAKSEKSNVFNIDFTWPLSPLQAFGICLSNFDKKWE